MPLGPIGLRRPGVGGVAQSGERRLCKPEVIGSNPFTSTSTGGSVPGPRPPEDPAFGAKPPGGPFFVIVKRIT